MNQTDSRGRDLRGDIVFAFALAIACYLAWQLRAVLLLLYVSALAAVVLTPVVRATSRFKWGAGVLSKGAPSSSCCWPWLGL